MNQHEGQSTHAYDGEPVLLMWLTHLHQADGPGRTSDYSGVETKVERGRGGTEQLYSHLSFYTHFINGIGMVSCDSLWLLRMKCSVTCAASAVQVVARSCSFRKRCDGNKYPHSQIDNWATLYNSRSMMLF